MKKKLAVAAAIGTSLGSLPFVLWMMGFWDTIFMNLSIPGFNILGLLIGAQGDNIFPEDPPWIFYAWFLNITAYSIPTFAVLWHFRNSSNVTK